MSGLSLPGYANISEIATGTFATVYRATELGTGRPVALKVLRVADTSRRMVEVFDQELAALSLLSNHPNVTTLYRAFISPEGRPVLVLELCKGSLAQRVRQSGPMPAQEVVKVGVKIAGALETAHRAGLLHRDMKPQNILVSEFDEPVLADFGVAALQVAAQSTEGIFGFTTLHAPPEALEGQRLSPSADIYGLASSMYQLLLGRGPFAAFEGEAPASVILRILRDPAPRPPASDVPIALADLLEDALAKDPARRPQRAGDFAEALREIEAVAGWPQTPYVAWGTEDGDSAEGPEGAEGAGTPASTEGVDKPAAERKGSALAAKLAEALATLGPEASFEAATGAGSTSAEPGLSTEGAPVPASAVTGPGLGAHRDLPPPPAGPRLPAGPTEAPPSYSAPELSVAPPAALPAPPAAPHPPPQPERTVLVPPAGGRNVVMPVVVNRPTEEAAPPKATEPISVVISGSSFYGSPYMGAAPTRIPAIERLWGGPAFADLEPLGASDEPLEPSGFFSSLGRSLLLPVSASSAGEEPSGKRWHRWALPVAVAGVIGLLIGLAISTLLLNI